MNFSSTGIKWIFVKNEDKETIKLLNSGRFLLINNDKFCTGKVLHIIHGETMICDL